MLITDPIIVLKIVDLLIEIDSSIPTQFDRKQRCSRGASFTFSNEPPVLLPTSLCLCFYGSAIMDRAGSDAIVCSICILLTTSGHAANFPHLPFNEDTTLGPLHHHREPRDACRKVSFYNTFSSAARSRQRCCCCCCCCHPFYAQ